MRSPSRLVLTTLLAALLVATTTSTAFAGSAGQSGDFDPMVSIERADFGGAQAQQVAARIDERLAIALAGPTWMECRNDAEAGFETCIVRTFGASDSKLPGTMAQN